MGHIKITRRRRHVGTTAAALLVVAVATGCGVLNDYSATERSTTGSVNVDAGPLALRHLRVVLDNGRAVGSPALRGSFVNSGDRGDRLLRVTSPVADTVRLTGVEPAAEPTVPLPAGEVARHEHPVDPSWVLEGVTRDLRAGASIPVTFHFAHQGRVAATVPVTSG